jgi:hypothetical protein
MLFFFVVGSQDLYFVAHCAFSCLAASAIWVALLPQFKGKCSILAWLFDRSSSTVRVLFLVHGFEAGLLHVDASVLPSIEGMLPCRAIGVLAEGMGSHHVSIPVGLCSTVWFGLVMV